MVIEMDRRDGEGAGQAVMVWREKGERKGEGKNLGSSSAYPTFFERVWRRGKGESLSPT